MSDEHHPRPDDPALEVQVEQVLRDELRLPIEDADTDLIEGGLLDSLTFVDLLFALEKRFSLQLPVERIHYEDFRSVRSIVALIERERSS